MDDYREDKWHWIVAGDNSRAWSSEARAYVTEWPSDRVTRIVSEAELRDVLDKAGFGDLAPRTIEDTKSRLKARVDVDAENVRLSYITPGVGMAMTYQEKRDEATAIHAIGQAAANALTAAERIAQFPTLAASVGTEADTLWACAQLVIAKAEAWADLAYLIESKRLAGKRAISDAADAAAARAAYEAITWSIP